MQAAPFSAAPAPPPRRACASSAGSRAAGAVMMAPSSARSEPTGQGSCSAGKSRATRAIEACRLGGVPLRDLDHGGDVDVVVLRVPAIVIRHHGDGGIGDLGLAGELGLRHGGHADHVVAEALVGERFGIGGELRPFDADIGAAAHDTGCFSASAAAAMRSCSSGPTGCAIDTCATQPLPKNELSRLKVRSTNWSTSTKRPGIELRLEGAAGRDGDQVGDACALHHVDIGAVVDVGREKAVAAPVAGQEDHLGLADAADPQHVGGLAPGRRDPLLAHVLEAGQVVDARPADDAENALVIPRFRPAQQAAPFVNMSLRARAESGSPSFRGAPQGANPEPINADIARKGRPREPLWNAAGYGFRAPLRGPGMTVFPGPYGAAWPSTSPPTRAQTFFLVK